MRVTPVTMKSTAVLKSTAAISRFTFMLVTLPSLGASTLGPLKASTHVKVSPTWLKSMRLPSRLTCAQYCTLFCRLASLGSVTESVCARISPRALIASR